MKMERLYKYTFSLLVMALLSMTQTSCIKEDMDDCPSNLRVYFDYLPATYASIKEGINPNDVKQINLYWFDAETDLLVGSEVAQFDNENPFSSDYYIEIPMLESGEYKFIAWGNLNGCYDLKPETPVNRNTTYDKLSISLNSIENDSVKSKISPLFFGQSGLEEIKQGAFTQDVRIPFVQNTYTFHVLVSGRLAATSKYKIVIADSNTHLGFDNSYIACPTINYVTQCGFPERNALAGELTTMKISRGRAPILKVVDENNEASPVFKANLVDLILELEKQHKIEIDFSQMYEFDIELYVDRGSFGITINGWKIIYEENELVD